MNKLVTIFGGSGFVGRYITQQMAKEGWRVRVACRRPNEALFVETYGVPGQLEPVFCNIRDDESVTAALTGADVVINCVGILSPIGKNSFGTIHADGAERIARLAAKQGISRLVHISAIGADANSQSAYARSKAAGEEGILKHIPSAHILRLSVVFGTEDQFFNRFAAMARMLPLLFIAGAKTKFQPVFVNDVARAAKIAAQGGASAGVYELGGPEVRSFHSLMKVMLDVIERRGAIVNIPFPIATLMASTFDLAQRMSFGVFKNKILTRDQLASLRYDNVVKVGSKGFDDLGIVPIALDCVLPEYLWCYRPSGQYAAIKESMKNIKKV